MEPIQKLFAQGLVSPFDVDERGTSALWKAVLYKKLAMCEFLLSQHADPNQVDVYLQSPNGVLLNHILSTPTDAATIELQTVMKFDSKSTESLLPKHRFSIIHLTVFGLAKIHLEAYLLISTTDIESRCSEGRTPLYWAAIRNDIATVYILLHFGARVEVVDNLSGTVLHHPLCVVCIETILSGASAHATSSSRNGPLVFKKYSKLRSTMTRQSDRSDDLWFKRFLNQPNSYGWSPLSFAAMRNDWPKLARCLLTEHLLVIQELVQHW